MSDADTATVSLPDGRTLAYAEYGDGWTRLHGFGRDQFARLRA